MEIFIVILTVIVIAVAVYEFISKTKIIKELNEKNNDLELKTQELYAQLNEAEKEKAKIDAENKLQKQTQEQQKIIFDNMQKIAEGKFKEIATELLTQKTKELKDNGNELILNKINPLINPLNEHLNYLQDKLASMQHLNENLQKEASALTTALTNQKKQGDFGEMLLEQLLESCGLKEGVHFQKQPNFVDEEGKDKRPDFIINMPKGRYMVIDSKMSLTAYNAYVNENDPAKKEKFLQEHIESIKKHIKELSEKKYQDLKELYNSSPDFVIMYVPLESAYLCALEKQKDLGLFASGKKVAAATASSLIPILKAIESLWAINTTQKNIEEVIKTGKKLHSQAVAFGEEMQKIGSALSTSQRAYDDALTKLQGKQGIVYYAKHLEDLGAKSSKQLPEIDFEEEDSIDELQKN